jgi:Family of unknown function (DUF6247)
MPADPAPSPLDPVRILAALPEADREPFLAFYREAVTAAVDPEGFAEVLRLLRHWSWHAVAAAQPGYAEAREAALTGTGTWIPLEDAVAMIRASR